MAIIVGAEKPGCQVAGGCRRADPRSACPSAVGTAVTPTGARPSGQVDECLVESFGATFLRTFLSVRCVYKNAMMKRKCHCVAEDHCKLTILVISSKSKSSDTFSYLLASLLNYDVLYSRTEETRADKSSLLATLSCAVVSCLFSLLYLEQRC
jgi:hypothetical protein